MAHDFDLRRTDEPYREPPRPAAGQGAGNDSLAELARLIEQEDPFAQMGKRPQAPQGAADPHADAEHAPNWLARPRQADEAAQPPGDDYYEAPPPKRRGGLTTIAALVGLAVFGTGAVFAFRAWSDPATTGDPPVISAEQSPTKIVPAQPSDGQASKQPDDRVGDNGGERVDSREEQPVDPRAAPRPTIPGVVGPPGPINVFPPLPRPPSPAVPAAPGDAKRVTTVTILTDQPGGIATPSAPPPPQSRVAPAPQAMTPTTPVTPRALPATGPARQVAARPASAEAGGYVVQVSSERTQAHAQASYRALQAKYPAVLGSHRLTIKRADLGEKGIFFRTQVGPFASAEEAGKMCNSLKAAGGQCIVQRN